VQLDTRNKVAFNTQKFKGYVTPPCPLSKKNWRGFWEHARQSRS